MSDSEKIDKEQLFESYLGVLKTHVRDGEPVLDSEGNVVGKKWNAQVLRQVLDLAKMYNLGCADVANSKAKDVVKELEKQLGRESAADEDDFPDDPQLPSHLRRVK